MKQIDKVMNEVTQSNYSEGLRWYREVNQYCYELASRFNKSPIAIAAAMSALSPACSFKQNKKDLESVLIKKSRATVSTYKTNKRKALDILRSNPQSIDDALTFFSPEKACKTRAFFLNIIDLDHDAVTIDRHMLRFVKVDFVHMTRKRYQTIEKQFQAAAQKHNVKPAQLQAIVWCHIRGAGQ